MFLVLLGFIWNDFAVRLYFSLDGFGRTPLPRERDRGRARLEARSGTIASCHSHERESIVSARPCWMPAFAGMTRADMDGRPNR
jgi:hypothetical protein